MIEQDQKILSDENEKVIGLKDLKPGDILIFEGDNSRIDNLIKRFTKSEACHGALFVQNGEKAILADSGGTGIDLHLLSTEQFADEEKRTIHVRRLTKKGGFGADYDSIVAPIVDAAYDYVRQDLPYPYSDLVLMAMILIYKNVSDEGLKQDVVIKLLRVATAELKKLIDDKYRDGKHTLVCSSYVYQCFLDASKNNPDLKLQIENGDLQPESTKKRVATLFDLYVEHATEYNFKTSHFADAAQEPVTESIDELLNNLVDDQNKNHVSLVKGNALSHAIEEFLKTLLKAIGTSVNSIEDLIKNARAQQAMFITPNDLLCHTTNTESVGVLDLYRDNNEYKP